MSPIKSFLCCILCLFAAYKGVFTSYRLAEFLHDQTLKNASNISVAAGGGLDACSGFLFLPMFWRLLLLILFVIQHTGMATKCYKQKMLDFGLQPIDRSLYVLATCWFMELIMNSSPLSHDGLSLWSVNTYEMPSTWLFFFVFHLVCWVIIYGSSILMDLPEFLGIKQVYHMCVLEKERHPMLEKAHQAQVFYKHMRHSGCVCLMLLLWVHPVMTLTRLLLASFWTLYLLFGCRVNEGDYLYLKEQRRRKAANLKLL